MSNELTTRHNDAAPLEFSGEQRQMIRDAFANGASDSEFAVLLEIAKARRLNPLMRQIHFVKRWNNDLRRETWSAQVAIDGLRAIAQRTGLYAGQDEPEFVEGDGPFPVLCRVRVYRTDWTRPAVGVAYWSEYVQTTKDGAPTRMWRQMPHVMLSKVAESIALRKAFPEDIGGLYSDAEMGQSESEAPEPRQPAESRRPIHAEPAPLTLPRDNGLTPSQAAAALAAPDTVDHYDLAARLIDGASTLPELAAAWGVVTRDHIPHLGPNERATIVAAKDARKSSLPAAPPPSDDPPPDGPTKPRGRPRKATPGDAAADSPAATLGASTGAQEGPAAWLATEEETTAHAATLTTEWAVQASARKHNAALAATPWGVRVYAQRLQAMGVGTEAQCARYVAAWCKHGPKAAATAQRRAA